MENIIAYIAPLVSLRKVIIKSCPNMTCLSPSISDLPRLEELTIGVFSLELDMFPFPTIDTNYHYVDDILTSLSVLNGPQRVGGRKFKSLVKLGLIGYGMDKVKSLPNSIRSLHQLRHLFILGFSGLDFGSSTRMAWQLNVFACVGAMEFAKSQVLAAFACSFKTSHYIRKSRSAHN